jgi:hypothetical protein
VIALGSTGAAGRAPSAVRFGTRVRHRVTAGFWVAADEPIAGGEQCMSLPLYRNAAAWFAWPALAADVARPVRREWPAKRWGDFCRLSIRREKRERAHLALARPMVHAKLVGGCTRL